MTSIDREKLRRDAAIVAAQLTTIKLTSWRVRRIVIEVDADSPDDQTLEAGHEVEIHGIVWRPSFVTHGIGATRVWELAAVRIAPEVDS